MNANRIESEDVIGVRVLVYLDVVHACNLFIACGVVGVRTIYCDKSQTSVSMSKYKDRAVRDRYPASCRVSALPAHTAQNVPYAYHELFRDLHDMKIRTKNATTHAPIRDSIERFFVFAAEAVVASEWLARATASAAVSIAGDAS